MSDNINKKFFLEDVDDEVEEERSDGKVVVRRRGTIQMLEVWIRSTIRMKDEAPMATLLSGFKKVRKLRQKPAHKLEDNAFDQSLFREQRELVIAAYQAVRTIRLMLVNHPACRSIAVDQYLYEGKISDI